MHSEAIGFVGCAVRTVFSNVAVYANKSTTPAPSSWQWRLSSFRGRIYAMAYSVHFCLIFT
jgi:hypothetical protein